MGQRSSIYNIAFNDCDQIYIGQTKRSIEARYKKHAAHFRLRIAESFAVAQHLIDNGHSIEKLLNKY